ncbi:MAG TPA: BTAD domain-containing putative transcriptional regulator, partial [Acidimicrobiia bacterium]|nr:BTAD domain-containing putative transcriptional regulator [Acidimicrobiia bacterium]
MVDSGWEFKVLGPLEVRHRGELVRIKSQKQRTVLAILLLQANRVVGVDSIIDGLWGDDPPPTAGAALQVHVAKLRKALAAGDEPSVIATRPPGYVIAVEPESLDLMQFEELVRRGRSELQQAKATEASVLLGRALACWRGPALADVASEPFAHSAAVRLGEERLAALADRIESDLARGAHDEVVGELRELTSDHPLRERFWEQLVLALYRCGNQAEALAAFQSARTALLEELGLEPGANLRALETAVLDQSASLDWTRHEDGVRQHVASTIVEDGAPHGRAHLESGDERIEVSGRTTIGRHPANVVVCQDAKVSRDHAVIRSTADGFVLTDLRSTN